MELGLDFMKAYGKNIELGLDLMNIYGHILN